VWAAILAPALVPAQVEVDLAGIEDPAVAAVTAMLASERALLDEALERYRALVGQRPDSVARLAELHAAIDEEVGKRGDAVPDRLDQLIEAASHAEADLGVRLAAEHDVARRIGEHLRRIAFLERRLAELEGRAAPEEAGALSGTWDLVLLPLDQKGSCVLQQTGAVVGGTYRLQGGYSGSLQGTLVNRKVYLVRIDSRLGKMMELEGFLSTDGRTIRGTWLNYELAGAEGSTGHWSATRRSPTP
jgi:hypothetical protein